MFESVFGVPLPVLAMAIGDPDSGLNDVGRQLAAQAILQQIQDDEEAAENWERMRFIQGLDDERTLQDLTADDIRLFCGDYFEHVRAGDLPHPMTDVIVVDGDETGVDLDEQEQELFNTVAATTVERLREAHFLSIDGDGDDAAEADLYVLLVGLLSNAGDLLRNSGYFEDATVMDAAAMISLRLFQAHVRAQRLA